VFFNNNISMLALSIVIYATDETDFPNGERKNVKTTTNYSLKGIFIKTKFINTKIVSIGHYVFTLQIKKVERRDPY